LREENGQREDHHRLADRVNTGEQKDEDEECPQRLEDPVIDA